MLSLSVTWDPTHGALGVAGTTGDSIVITDDTYVKVNGQDVSDGVLAQDVQSIAVTGAGSANIDWDRNAYISAAAQNNTIELISGATAYSVTLDANPNAASNTLDFSGFSASQPIKIDIGSTAAQTVSPGVLTLTLASSSAIDSVIGGAGDDFISGNSRDNALYGAAGNDVLDGRSGTNRLYGGPGNNRLIDGAGEWLVKFDNVPGDTTEEQLPYIQGLFHDAGLDQLGIEASAHAGVNGVVIVQADPDSDFQTVEAQLQDLPGFNVLEPWNEDNAGERQIYVPESPFGEGVDAGELGDPVDPGGTALTATSLIAAFDGINRTNTLSISPPDPTGAAGPNSFIEAVNVSLAIYNKTGGTVVVPTLFSTFFAPLGTSGISFSDPVVVYNEMTQRFAVGILDFHRDGLGNPTDSRFDFAISKSSNPTTVSSSDWNFFRYNTNDMIGGSFTFSDYPKIGYNADGYVISFNMFVSSFNHTSVLGIGNTGTSTGMRVVGGVSTFTLAPASEHGALTGAPMWFTCDGNGAGGGSTVSLIRIDNPFSTAAVSGVVFTRTVTSYGNTLAAGPRQPGGSLGSTADLGTRFYFTGLRTVGGVTHLVSAHAIGNGTGDSVRWYDFNVSNLANPVVIQQGNVNANISTTDTYFPGVDIAPDGTIGMSYSESGTSEYMSMYVTAHRPTDAAGVMQTPVLAKASTVNLNSGGRAGDYSFTSVDPVDGTFWAVNEYAFNVASPNWATWIQQFDFTPPKVIDVVLRGSGWNSGVSYSYASLVPLGKQLAPIYTDGVNTIKVQFTEDVRHWNGSQLSQLNGTELTLLVTGTRNSGTTLTIPGTFSGYDPNTHIATWTYSTPLAGDRYRIEIASALVRDVAGNSLDGKWDNLIGPIGGAPATQTLYDWTNDPQNRTLLSGNGGSGTDFKFLFALQPGDYNRDGYVDGGDYVLWRDHQNVDGNGDGNGVDSPADYNVWRAHEGNTLPFLRAQADFNADGIVDVMDFAILRSMFGNTGTNLAADANNDHVVDSEDLVIYLVWRNTKTAWYLPVTGAASAMAIVDSDSAPWVTNVTISGFNSTHDPYSFATHVGSGEQLRTVPVGGADTISITFSEEVNVEASYLRVVGLVTANVPALAEFTYDVATMTATWRFENLTANDIYVMSLSDAVTDTEGYRLDGEWVNPATTTTTNSLVSEFPSGDGHAGENFNFVFTLLAGDTNLNNYVDITDYIMIWQYLYAHVPSGLFTQGDFTGDGLCNTADANAQLANQVLDLRTASMLGDLNGDFAVNDADFDILRTNYGMSNATHADGDLNGDGHIDNADVDLMFAQYGMELAVAS